MRYRELRQRFTLTDEIFQFIVSQPMSILCPCLDNLLKISETVEEWVVSPK